MKNIHILPTSQPSRLIINWEKDLCYKSKPYLMEGTQNIYITSDEEIKEGDWYLELNEIHKFKLGCFTDINSKKIILTTDQDLIKDGVQAIDDDEFLEWFVAHPSCEEVKVNYGLFTPLGRQVDPMGILRNHSKCVWKHNIIIPKEEPKQDAFNYSLNAFKVPKEYFGKEEPKQVELLGGIEKGKRYVVVGEPKKETLEDIAQWVIEFRFTKNEYAKVSDFEMYHTIIEKVTKWQQEQDKNKYSEEEVISAMKSGYGIKYFSEQKFLENLRQFKKK